MKTCKRKFQFQEAYALNSWNMQLLFHQKWANKTFNKSFCLTFSPSQKKRTHKKKVSTINFQLNLEVYEELTAKVTRHTKYPTKALKSQTSKEVSSITQMFSSIWEESMTWNQPPNSETSYRTQIWNSSQLRCNTSEDKKRIIIFQSGQVFSCSNQQVTLSNSENKK